MHKYNGLCVAFPVIFLACATMLIHSAAHAELIYTDSFEGPVSITSFTASAESIFEGESSILSWTTDSATSCTPSGGTGGWDTSNTGLPSGSAEIVFPTMGSYEFTLTCQGAAGSSAVAMVTVTVAAEVPVVITSFTASPESIFEGESSTLSWATDNAASCTPSGGTGGWDTVDTSVPGGSTEIVFPTMGSYDFTLTCQGTAVSSTQAMVSVTVAAEVPVTITSFTAAPETINAGESTTLSWTTDNATSCTPSGGTGGWDAVDTTVPGGSADIEIPTPGSYDFTLTCLGTAVSSMEAMVTVTVTDIPANCDTPTLGGDIFNWIDFWLVEFPFPVSETRIANVRRFGYFAIKFNTGDVDDDGQLSLFETTATTGLRTGSISECPGEFDEKPDCTHEWGLGGGIRWATNNRVGACKLKANTNYYFNVTFTDGVDNTVTQCEGRECRIEVNHSNAP